MSFAAPSVAAPVHASKRSDALDGVRAVAVLGVILFHLGVQQVAGGLLGVDLFFVLSGFLITGLLLSEWRRSSRISLKDFWIRRWRRLLPALFLTLIIVGICEHTLADPAEVESVRQDMVATLFYGANWNSIAAGHSYFDAFAAPSPLRHTWSLGVEEQFYVIWPLIAIACLVFACSRRLLTWVAAGGAVASAVLMGVLSANGTNVDRLYYGTDTRAQALMIGATLACLFDRMGRGYTGRFRDRPGVRHVELSARNHLILGFASLAAAAGVLAMLLRVDGEAPWLYRGGFALVALLTAIVIASVILLPDAWLSRALAAGPMPYIGRISYGLYLYHWPAIVFLTPARTGLNGFWLGVLRAGTTLVVSVLSYHLVEVPIRTRRFRIPFAKLAVPTVVAGATALLLIAPAPKTSGTLAALKSAQQPPPPPKAPPPPAANVTPTPTVPPKSGAPKVLAPAVTHPGPLRVMLIGDSVAYALGLGLGPALDPNQVVFTPQGYVGCGIARGGATSFASYTQPAACLTWPDRWKSLTDTFRPDVTLVLLGRWEVLDRVHDGTWMHLGQPVFDNYIRSELELATQILTSDGGRVAFLNPPCNDRSRAEAASPGRLPPDDAQRIQRLDQLTQEVVDKHPGMTERVPFDRLICPGGKYEHTLNGMPFRTSDGVHLEPYAGQLFAQTQLQDILKWLRQPVLTAS